MPIPFTLYRIGMKPVQLDHHAPPEIEQKAQELIDAGCAFDVEILRTHETSFTCMDFSKDVDEPKLMAIQVCEADADADALNKHIVALINNAHHKLMSRGKTE